MIIVIITRRIILSMTIVRIEISNKNNKKKQKHKKPLRSPLVAQAEGASCFVIADGVFRPSAARGGRSDSRREAEREEGLGFRV